MLRCFLQTKTGLGSFFWASLPQYVAKDTEIRGTFWLLFTVCLLVSTLGCGGQRKGAQHVEVSGKVTYNGKPVTGGSIAFVTDDGFNGTGVIDEQGNYKINAPVGNVKIAVDNSMLGRPTVPSAMRGAGPRPGGPEPTPIKGKYVQIPPKYYNVAASPLTYTVKSGAQTHDIDLKD